MKQVFYLAFLLSSSVYADSHDSLINEMEDKVEVLCHQVVNSSIDKASDLFMSKNITKQNIMEVEKELGGNLEDLRSEYIQEALIIAKAKSDNESTKVLESCLETKCKDNAPLNMVFQLFKEHELEGIDTSKLTSKYKNLTRAIIDNVSTFDYGVKNADKYFLSKLGISDKKDITLMADPYGDRDTYYNNLYLEEFFFYLEYTDNGINKSKYKKLRSEFEEFSSAAGFAINGPSSFSNFVTNSINDDLITVKKDDVTYGYNIVTGKVEKVSFGFEDRFTFEVGEDYDLKVNQRYLENQVDDESVKKICMDSFRLRTTDKTAFSEFLGIDIHDDVIVPLREGKQTLNKRNPIYETVTRETKGK